MSATRQPTNPGEKPQARHAGDPPDGASGREGANGREGRAGPGAGDRAAAGGRGGRDTRDLRGKGEAPASRWRRLFERLHDGVVVNLGLKLLSLILALTVYLLVNSDRDREIKLNVDVLYKEPEDKVLVSERPEKLNVVVRGPWRRLRHFDEREVEPVKFDLSQMSAGEVTISNDMVRVPGGLAVVAVSPRSFRVAFEKKVEKTVAVAVSTMGRTLHGYAVKSVTVTPATVAARGAQGVIAALSTLPGREVRVDGRSDSFEAETALLPPDGVVLDGQVRASVRVEIKEELVNRPLGQLPVQLRADGFDLTRYSTRPAQVEVTLTGALLAVERAIEAGVNPQARLTPGQQGELTVTVDTAVPGVGIKINPPRVKLVRK